MMENDDFSANWHSEKTETGLLSAISAEFKFNFTMEFCIAEQWAAGLYCSVFSPTLKTP